MFLLQEPTMMKLAENIWWGLRRGLYFGGLAATLAVAIAVVRLFIVERPMLVASPGALIVFLIAVIGLACVAGAIVGALRSFASKGYVGAAATGLIVGGAVFFLSGALFRAVEGADVGSLASLALVGAMVGTWLGFLGAFVLRFIGNPREDR